MINFPMNHIKKISGLVSSKHASSVSSVSSFRKPDLSKECECGNPNQIQTKTQMRPAPQQRKNDTSTNRIRPITSMNDTGTVVVKAVTFEKTARVRRVRPRNQYS